MAVGDDAGDPPFLPAHAVHISDAHMINSITARTRFGAGNRHSRKTILRGDVDIVGDLAEINSGRASQLENGDILTSSGRTYGRHPGRDAVFPRSGCPGTVDLTQAEFRVLQEMVDSGGLIGHALTMLNAMTNAKNPGLSADSAGKLLDLYTSRRR